MRFKFLLTLMIVTGFSATAQFNWPEDPAKRSEAQEKWTLFSDSEQTGNYEAAKPHLEYILTNYPKLSESTYITGIKIWDESYDNAKTDEARNAAAQKVMDLYEKRFELYPESKKENIGRQAISAYKYYYKDADKTQFLLDIFKETYELEGNEAFYPVGRYYMQIATLAYARKTGLTDQEILDIYDRSTEHIDYQIKKAQGSGKSTKSMLAIKEFIDEKIANLGLINCEFIVNKLVPEFKQHPDDMELANKIFVHSLSNGCTDADWFQDAAVSYFNGEPNYGVAILLASRFAKAEDYVTAIDYYRKGIELTDENTDKGKALKQIAQAERLQGNKAEARKTAIEAAEIDPTLKEEMYTLIGDMVLSSHECDKKESQVDDRAKFIVAYDYYIQGGNNAKASQARSYFPSQAEIFTEGKELGESVFVGCWIQKSVKLQKRPDQQ